MASGTGNLPYPGKVYNPFDVLTAEELNEDVENIESLADGSGIGDGAIPTAAIADGAVTPIKLANFNYQTDNGGTISSSTNGVIKLQAGWGQMVGNSSNTMTEAVTFPQEFSTVLGVVMAPLAAKATSNAANISELDTGGGGPQDWAPTPLSITNSGFTTQLNRHVQAGGASQNFNNTIRYGYSWLAWGLV